MGGIDAHEPVGFAACSGGIVKIVVLGSAFEMGKSFPNGFVRERTDPESLKRLGDAKILVDESEY